MGNFDEENHFELGSLPMLTALIEKIYLPKMKSARPGVVAVCWLIVTAGILVTLFTFMDLKPQVDQNFFFSSDDPQFKSDKIINRIFPQPPQLIMSVKGEIYSEAYAEKIGRLTGIIQSVDEVFSVQSITNGPDDVRDALESPLWKRILVSEDGQATFLSIFVTETNIEGLVDKLLKIRKRFQSPNFNIMISGAPYIMEMIRLNLLRDLKMFSAAALLIFGVILLIAFKSLRLLFGILVTCMNMSALTIIVANLLQIKMGPLTANLSTIVFVLTLSHIVFITFNWLYLSKNQTDKQNLLLDTLRMTFPASLWSMLTTLLGFASLLFVSARPLQQLGISGAIGSLLSFVGAYSIYPWFLQIAGRTAADENVKPKKRRFFRVSGFLSCDAFFQRKHLPFVLALVVLAGFVSQGLRQLNTDPSLVSYFKEGSEMREGLEYIDRSGGSSPLKIVVADKDRRTFNTGEMYKELWKLHEALEKDPAVGNVV
ncbi:MMPL family transporter, partial [Omnitrophica bacterium]|nr:MMPL family transporter [Candidatus Omnitrophota bacterium]